METHTNHGGPYEKVSAARPAGWWSTWQKHRRKHALPEATAAVLFGPSHAEEVSRGLPTTCVAAYSKQAAQTVQNLFMGPVFRAYTNPDVLGVELGGALNETVLIPKRSWGD